MIETPTQSGDACALPRAHGKIRATFESHGGRTRVKTLYETGGLRLRFPRAGDICEGVIVNTAGGIVGGDTAALDFSLDPGARAILTTQSAEKIYRTDGPDAVLSVSLTLQKGARLEYLPQEAILFDAAAFSRALAVDMAEDASLLICESIVFGRQAMGETFRTGRLSDIWRIKRGGKLIFADHFRLDGAPAAILDGIATGGEARATGLLLFIAPDAESRLEDARKILANVACEGAASAFNGFLVVRLLSPSPENFRHAMLALLEGLRQKEAPRVWR